MNDYDRIVEPGKEERFFSASSVVGLMGLSAYLAWSICRIIPTLFPQPMAGAKEILLMADLPHSIAYILVLVILGFGVLGRLSLAGKRILALVLAALISLGTAVIYLSGWGSEVVPAGIWVGTVVISLEMGFFLLWGEIYSRLSIKQCFIGTAAAYSGAFFVCIVIVNLTPAFCLLVHSLLPLLSGFLLWVSYEGFDNARRGVFPKKAIEAFHHAALPIKFLVGFALLAFIQLLISDLSEYATSNTTELNSIIGGFFASSAAVILAAIFPKRGDFGLIYRFFTPAIIICVLLVLIAEPGAPPYEIYAVAACWAFFRISTWVMWCFLCGKLDLSPFYMFGAGQIALTLGGIVEKAIKPSLLALPGPVVTLVPSVIILTLFTGLILLNERHIVELFGKASAFGIKQKPRAEERALSPSAVETFRLTQREQEIALLVLAGRSNAEIEDELCIAPSTLKTHLRNIYAKCEVHNKSEFIVAVSEESGAVGE